MTRRLAVIPARGGSKRIARKNLRDFGGQPAFTHILGAAAQSELFDTIHVSTDDEAIAQAAALAGFPPGFARDARLADDHTPIRSVVSWVVQQYAVRGEHFDTVTLLYATAFFVTAETLIAACEAYETGDRSQPLLGVVDVGTPLEKLFRVENGLLTTVDAAQFGKRTQDLTPVYRDAGALGMFDATALLSDSDGAKSLDFRAFPLDPWVGIDIDTEDDWAFAQRLFAGGQAQQFKDRL